MLLTTQSRDKSDRRVIYRFAAYQFEKTTKSSSCEAPTKDEKAKSPRFTD